MPFYNHDWHYSHQDIDVGDLIGSTKDSRRLRLRMRRQVVDRAIRVLWRRSGFYSRDLKQKFGQNFQFKVERNPVAGVYYKELTGYVLWRTWYRLEATPTGGIQARKEPDEQLVAVVLGGSPVWRLSDNDPTLTDEMRREFGDAFIKDIVTVDELIERNGR